MNFRLIFFSIGLILALVSAAMMIPALIDYADGHILNAKTFFVCGAGGIFIGLLMAIGNSHFERRIGARDGFLLTTLCWFLASLLASLPFHFSDLHLGYTDSFFESVSGLTTTGATVIAGLETKSRGILLWRSLLVWIGGMGVIGLAIIFLPFLKIGGMQLFQAESSDKSEKFLPRSGKIISGIFITYSVLSLICMAAYHAFGMNWFDALNHAMTTLGTGGFSTRDSSFMQYNNSIQWAATLFMALAGMPLILFFRFYLQRKVSVFRDSQVYTYLGIITLPALLIAAWLITHGAMNFNDALRHSFFNITSVITTTGYASADYIQWGTFPVMLILFLTYLGGCSGSTSGGLKTMRLEIIARHGITEIKRLFQPYGVFITTYQGKQLDMPIVQSVMVFAFIYVLSNAFLTLLLCLLGVDFITALSGVATAIANVGPGLGPIIGPAGNFIPLSDAATFVLAIGMLLGRLELMTALVLFHPSFWRH